MVLGEKLWEGKGKSQGPGFIKSIDMNGVESEYTWTAQIKGLGQAKGADFMVHLTAVGNMPMKGLASEEDLGTFMRMGDGGVIKGYGLMKMMTDKNPQAVSLWQFMTTSEKLDWMNTLIAVVIFEALDPMWEEFKITIHEWK